MKLNMGKWVPALGALMVAAAITPGIGAQCFPHVKSVKPASWHPGSANALLRPAAFAKDDDDDGNGSIVGMWHVIFTAKTLNGAAVDFPADNSLVVWHSDKTEIMNSGRPAQDGNFCMGVWEKTGKFTYKLNHFAWAGNDNPEGAPPAVVGLPIGPVHYQEEVTLDPDRKHYTGKFILQQYDTFGAVTVTITGKLKGTRITV
ncbi:MAG TPA: hypothetical protein VM865_02475, partial [Acidobacteriaceae bacterium]|nr:hypothetical protein [Acidobacteriaceae bacterium]